LLQLNKNSYIPLCKQLEKIISERIIRGVYNISDKIPSQKMFMQEFNVSRITVRNCMANLIESGTLESFKGKGTYIKRIPSLSNEYHSHSGLTAQLERRQQKLETLIISKEILKATKLLNEILLINTSNDVYKIKRIRKIDHKKFSYETNFLNPSIINNNNFLYSLTDNTSMYNILYRLSDIEIDYAEESITPIISDKTIAGLLDVELHTPLLKVKRLTFAKGVGTPFEYTEYIIKPEYYGTITYRNIK